MPLSAKLLTNLLASAGLPVLLAATLPLAGAGAAGAASLEGKISLYEKGKAKTDREVRAAVVYFEPEAPVELEIPDEPFQVVMVRKAFLPRVMAVPVGSRVRFPNEDRILHNAFSLSPGNRFDLGLYRRGEAKEAEMRSAGVVQVYCNVHHSMVAYVLALDTPFFVHPEPDGTFTLDGLPEGPGKLTVWHERTDTRTVNLQIPSLDRLDIRLDVTKPRLQPHRNKFGKPYKRRRGKAY